MFFLKSITPGCPGVLNRIYTNKEKLNIKGVVDSTFFVIEMNNVNFLNNLVHLRPISPYKKPNLTKKVFLEKFKYPDGITYKDQYLNHKFYYYNKKYYYNEKYFIIESDKKRLLEW